ALGNSSGLLDEFRGRWGLGDEGERTVFVHRDLHRDHVAPLRFGGSVVGLAELHDVDTVLTQRGAERRCRSGGASLNLKFDQTSNLLLGRHKGPSKLWLLEGNQILAT